MNNSAEIKYNKEQANYGIEQLKQCQKELYEADELFYKGIMALASAKGIDLIINEDSGINLYMPEKIVIECREGITNLIKEITTKINLIEGFNQEPKETTDKVQNREISDENTQAKEQVSESKEDIKVVYNHPTEANEIATTNQTNQLIYGSPGVTASEITTPDPAPATNPEYETIPDTGIPKTIEKNYISKHPKLIGGLAATIGLFGLPTIISDDIDEQEEIKYNNNKKKD